jgi:hypothetical protein
MKAREPERMGLERQQVPAQQQVQQALLQEPLPER